MTRPVVVLVAAFIWLSTVWDGTYAKTCGGKNRAADPIFDHPTLNISKPSTNGVLPDVTVACYYYPWYTNGFHNGEEYLRDYLVPRQQPSMGEYDDTVPATIAEHLRMSRQSNCRVWFTSWWGPNSVTDMTTRKILQHPDLHQHKIAVHYESLNRLRKKDVNDTIPNQAYYYTLEGDPKVDGDGLGQDMQHLCTYYFNHPNYYKINGRPVIVMYLTRVLDDVQAGLPQEAGTDLKWDKFEFLTLVINAMRAGSIQSCGLDPFIIGDQVFSSYRSDSDPTAMTLLNAITNYDVYGHTDQDKDANMYGGDNLPDFYNRMAVWKQEANNRGCGFIPAVAPGFNDRAVRLRTNSNGVEAVSLSRRLRNAQDPEGSFLAKSMEYALTLLDPLADRLMAVTSFNEIHEDSQVECMMVDPVVTVTVKPDGTTPDIESTNQAYHIWNAARNGYIDPSVYKKAATDTDLTQGLVYEAYYDLYLNILREMSTVPIYSESFDVPAGSNPLSIVSGAQQVLQLTRTDPAVTPKVQITLDASAYTYFIIDFWYAASGTQPGEPLVVQCFHSQTSQAAGGDMLMMGETYSDTGKWEYGTNYSTYMEYNYAVTECNVTEAAGMAVVEFRFESASTGGSSIFLDDIKVTGLTARTDSTRAPTYPPTRAPTYPPTRAPTSLPTKAPTSLPTRAPTSLPTKAPTVVPTSPPTRAPTTAPTRTPTSTPTRFPTRAPTNKPTVAPTRVPTRTPTRAPTRTPTRKPA